VDSIIPPPGQAPSPQWPAGQGIASQPPNRIRSDAALANPLRTRPQSLRGGGGGRRRTRRHAFLSSSLEETTGSEARSTLDCSGDTRVDEHLADRPLSSCSDRPWTCLLLARCFDLTVRLERKADSSVPSFALARSSSPPPGCCTGVYITYRLEPWILFFCVMYSRDIPTGRVS
jgi:hypothetical protein